MALRPDTLAKLAKFDTPTICNVIELFDVRHAIRVSWTGASGRISPSWRPWWASRVRPRFAAGRRHQRRCLRKLSGAGAPIRGPARPAVMVFQDLDDPPVGATFGEVMCSVYKGLDPPD